jgi:hypothetical protein
VTVETTTKAFVSRFTAMVSAKDGSSWQYFETTLLVDRQETALNLSISNVITVQNENETHNCYCIELSNVSLTGVLQPVKVPLENIHQHFDLNADFPNNVPYFSDEGHWVQMIDACSLLGTAHAIPLHAMVVDRLYSISNSQALSVKPRVLCIIYTYEQNHPTRLQVCDELEAATLASCIVYQGYFFKAVKSTWGKRCTGFIALSTAEDIRLPAVKLPHLGEEHYQNMWQKVRSSWKYVAKNYAEDFDWFLMGGDDMYYVMDNLYALLSSSEVTRAQMAGKGIFTLLVSEASVCHSSSLKMISCTRSLHGTHLQVLVPFTAWR